MLKKLWMLVAVFVMLAIVAACGAAQPETITVVETVIVKEEVEVIKEVEGETVTVIETVEVVKEVEVEVVKEVEVEVVVTAELGPKSVETHWPDMSWDEVLAEAEGQSVNFHFWGGNTKHNTYVSEYIGGRLQDEYGVTLNPVLIEGTMASVNQVLGEYEAGRVNDGSIDMIWINGNSFKTLRQADLLFGPYAAELPNGQYIAEDNPGWGYDFGHPVQGYESHWGHGMFVFGYDSAVIADPPTTVDGLLTWICDNPGRFTYPSLPTFVGRRFVTEVFYRVTGGHEQWQGRWTAEKQALWDEKSPLLWEALNEIEPCLWREGETYPADVAPLNDLYANGEVDWAMFTNAFGPASQTIAGLFPETTQTLIFEDGTVSGTHYVGIMANSPNKAASMVLANLLQDPEAQLLYGDPDVRGDMIAIDPNLTDFPEKFAEIDYGPGALSPAELNPKLPHLPVETVPLLEEGWRIHVLEN